MNNTDNLRTFDKIEDNDAGNGAANGGNCVHWLLSSSREKSASGLNRRTSSGHITLSSICAAKHMIIKKVWQSKMTIL